MSKSPQMDALLACLSGGEPVEAYEAIAAVMASGVSEEQARKCLSNALTNDRISRVIGEGGHTQYVARHRGELPATARNVKPARKAAKKPRAKRVAAKTPAAAFTPPSGTDPACFGVFADGSVLIEDGAQSVRLDAEKAVALIAFLRRVGAIREGAPA